MRRTRRGHHSQAAAAPGAASATHDVVTWAASADRLGEGTPGLAYRLVVRTSAGGSDLEGPVLERLRRPAADLDSLRAGIQRSGAALVPGSNRRLTFGGAGSVTVPAGATVLSDALLGRRPAGASLVVSLHSPDAVGPATGHGMAMQTSYTARGDHTAEEGAANWTRHDRLLVLPGRCDGTDHRRTGAVAAPR